MPRYDYECGACHNVFEVKQSFDSEPVATCPECQNGARRVFHSVPIVFKGSGFYVNDYGKGGANGKGKPKAEESSDTGSKSKDGDGKAKTKSESTPAKGKTKPAKASAESE